MKTDSARTLWLLSIVSFLTPNKQDSHSVCIIHVYSKVNHDVSIALWTLRTDAFFDSIRALCNNWQGDWRQRIAPWVYRSSVNHIFISCNLGRRGFFSTVLCITTMASSGERKDAFLWEAPEERIDISDFGGRWNGSFNKLGCQPSRKSSRCECRGCWFPKSHIRASPWL